MPIYLVNQSFRKRLIGKPGEQLHPLIQIWALVFTSHSQIVVFDDLNERAHDSREGYNADEHEKDSADHFVDGDREEVSVAHCWEGRERIVTHDDGLSNGILMTPPIGSILSPLFGEAVLTKGQIPQSCVQIWLCFHGGFAVVPLAELMRIVIPVYFIERPISDKSVSCIDVRLLVHVTNHEPPERPNQICDHENDGDQAENLVVVYEDKLGLDSICSCWGVEVAFDHSLDAAHVKDGYHFRKTWKSDHSRVDGVFDDEVKRKSGQKVDEHPTALRIPYRDFLEISNFNESFLIPILLKTVKYEVQGEEKGDDVIQDCAEASGLYIEWDVENRCGTWVSDNHQNECVKHSFPGAIERNNEIFQIKKILELKLLL